MLAELNSTGDEQATAAQQIRGAAAQHQETAEDQRVGVDDPLQVVGGEVQAALDRGQRDVHDRVVEHDHELGHARDHEDQPAVVFECARCHRNLQT
jgi:hypothetical protein